MILFSELNLLRYFVMCIKILNNAYFKKGTMKQHFFFSQTVCIHSRGFKDDEIPLKKLGLTVY